MYFVKKNMRLAKIMICDRSDTLNGHQGQSIPNEKYVGSYTNDPLPPHIPVDIG